MDLVKNSSVNFQSEQQKLNQNKQLAYIKDKTRQEEQASDAESEGHITDYSDEREKNQKEREQRTQKVVTISNGFESINNNT